VRIAELLAGQNAAELMRGVQALEQFAPDYAQLLDELAALLVRVALRQTVSDYEGDEQFAPEVIERLAAALTPADVQLFYQTAITGRRDLPLAPEPRVGFEMTLLRMVAFRPADLPAGTRAGGSGAAVRAPAGAPSRTAARAAAPPPGAVPAGRGDTAAPAAAPESGEVALAAAPESWLAIVNALELGGAARQLASHCALLSRQGAVVRLALDAQHQQLRTPAQEEKLAQALARYFGAPVRLEFHAQGGGETPALVAQRASLEELAGARRAFEADPGVQGLRERFGATVLPDTVRPVK
jgi:DNA polymerase-3 subunit gamma/tau